jgi:radical SAM superfamily enzyme YgiQ (UPF0313 family)
MNMGYLSSWAKKYCPESIASIEFYSGFYDKDETIFEACDSADIVGITATSPQWKEARRYGEAIKARNPKAWIVVGGFHATACPEDCGAERWVDSVVLGEGERSFQAVIEGCREKRISFPQIENLDTIPPPDRAVIKFERHLERSQRLFGQRMGDMFTSRGCPFGCIFCASRSVWGRKQRLHSPHRIAREMVDLKFKYDVDWIAFADDEFGLNPSHALEFVQCKSSNGAADIEWGCNMVASSIVKRPDVVEAFKKAKCRTIWIGVETGSPRIMAKTGKGVTRETVQKAFQIVKQNGIESRAYFLLGMPGETEEDILLTESLADSLEADIIGFTILCPYPGSALYKREEHGNYPWENMDEYGNKFWRNESLDNERLLYHQRRLAEKFTLRIAWHQKEEENLNPSMKENP